MGSFELSKELDFCLIRINITAKSFFIQLVHHRHGFAVSGHVVALKFRYVVEDVWNQAKNCFTGSGNVGRKSDVVPIHENVKRQVQFDLMVSNWSGPESIVLTRLLPKCTRPGFS